MQTRGSLLHNALLPQGIATVERPMSQAKARYAEWRHAVQNIERFRFEIIQIQNYSMGVSMQGVL